MDWQTLFNGVLTIALAIVSGYVRFVQGQLRDAKVGQAGTLDRLHNFELKVAENYVTHTDIRRIEDALVRIEAKMDVKADK